jgi:hypothetical protein
MSCQVVYLCLVLKTAIVLLTKLLTFNCIFSPNLQLVMFHCSRVKCSCGQGLLPLTKYRIGTPPPLLPQESESHGTRGRRHTRLWLRGRGGGAQFGRHKKNLYQLCAATWKPRWCKISHRILNHQTDIFLRTHLTFFRNPLSVLECSAKMTELPLE